MLAAAALALAGCGTAAKLSGDYKTPQGDISGSVGFSTNSVDLSGSYDTTNQALSGALEIAK